jgi:hypothetical protein
VTRNLRRGRFLLSIVGDGITENLEGLAEFLDPHAGLHFGLILVQLDIHELPNGSELLVVPSIPIHKNTVVRGIVEWTESTVRIVPPKTVLDTAPASLTKEHFFPALDQIRPGTSDRLVGFVESCADLQLTWDVKRTLLTRMIVGEFKIIPFAVDAEGTVDMGSLMKTYAQRLATAIPDALARETVKYWTIQKDGRRTYIWDMLDHRDDARAALEELNRALRAAGEE